MAGTQTTRFLASNTYATFHQIAHDFSEQLLARVILIGDRLQQVQAAGEAAAQTAEAYSVWCQLASFPGSAYQQLQTVLTPVGFEAQMFRERPARRQPSDR